MYCVKCGSPLPEGQPFCANCGAPAPGRDTARQGAESENAQAGQSAAHEQNAGYHYASDYGAPPQQPYTAPVQKKQSTLGIIALVLSFFIAPVALILAIVDLVRNDKTEDHGCAIGGLVVSIVIVLVFVILIAAGIGIASDLTAIPAGVAFTA